MKFSDIFEKFIKKSPVSVIGYSLVERVLAPDQLNDWFSSISEKQYTRKLLFSSVLDLMSSVVNGVSSSVNAAFQIMECDLGVTRSALYNKINSIEIGTSAALVKKIASELEKIIIEISGERPSLLPGYRVKMLDGNCIEATHHRISELRDVGAGALPGKTLVVFDPSLGIAIDVFPCEDGHAQERSLLPEVIKTVEESDLWIADRNFCTRNFLFGIGFTPKSGSFIIREHKGLPFEVQNKFSYSGKSADGKMYEQKISISNANNDIMSLRRVKVVISNTNRDGDKEIYLVTNLPEDVSAKTIAMLYRKRWSIETAFQHLEKNLNSEVNTLGYPKAAIFAFCTALVSFNIMETIVSTLRSVHGEVVDEKVSNYYIAEQISAVSAGLSIAISDDEWGQLNKLSIPSYAKILMDIATQVKLKTLKKHKRAPKGPATIRTFDKKHPHVSTHKLISKRKS
jgi:hypothetical protein